MLLGKDVGGSFPTTIPARQKELTYFAMAAVKMWLRAVHSFLISVSLTKASPIWSSVAGYYSSHYSIRASPSIFLGVSSASEKTDQSDSTNKEITLLF